MQYAESILDLVGETPLVRITRLTGDLGPARPPAAPARQARDAQPGRLGQGPDRAADDRGGRTRRPAQAGRHDHRADVRQHRSRPGDRGRAQGLPLHLRHGRQAVVREAAAPAGVRRRGRAVPDQRRARVARELLLGGGASRPRHPRCVQARPVLERRRTRPPTSGRPVRSCGTRPTAGSPTSSRASGTGGTISGAARVLKARNPAIQVDRGGPGRQRPVRRHRPAVPDRGSGGGLRPGHLRPVGHRPLGPRQRPRRVRDGPPAHPRGGDPRRAARAGPRWSPRCRSSASWRRRPTGRDGVVVVLLPDSGRSYLSKIYNDEWMRVNGLLATTGAVIRVDDLLDDRHHAGPLPDLVIARTTQRVGEAIAILQEYRDQPAAGLGAARRRRARGHRRLDHREGPARPGLPRPVDRRADRRRGDGPAAAARRRLDASLDEAFALLSDGSSAVIATSGERPVGVVTRLDVLEYLAHRRDGRH